MATDAVLGQAVAAKRTHLPSPTPKTARGGRVGFLAYSVLVVPRSGVVNDELPPMNRRRDIAKRWHPDAHPNASPAEKERLGKRFAEEMARLDKDGDGSPADYEPHKWPGPNDAWWDEQDGDDNRESPGEQESERAWEDEQEAKRAQEAAADAAGKLRAREASSQQERDALENAVRSRSPFPPRWAVSAITIVVVTMVGLFAAGQLGRMAGERAAAETLKNRRMDQGRNVPSVPETGVATAGRSASQIDPGTRPQAAPLASRSDSATSMPPRRNSNFVKLSLPKGVSVELPKNWGALTESQRVTLDSGVEASQDLAGITRPESDLPFAANFLDEGRMVAAMFNVRFYPDMEWTQDFVSGLGAEEIGELDSVGRAGTEASLQSSETRLLEWRGTKKVQINGITALVVEYRRTGARSGTTFCARLVKVFNAGRSFTATVSYREDAERLLRPICDRIIESIRQD